MNYTKIWIRTIISLLLTLVIFAACHPAHVPRPRGYIRIELPEKQYQLFDTIYPFKFEYPVYSHIQPVAWETTKPGWLDLVFPGLNAIIHISYMRASNQEDIYQFMEDGRTFINKHIPKATGFREQGYSDPHARVYGVIYEILGRETASPIQFLVTDSLDHFIRGALYFNMSPNNDSLAPVIDFIHQDVIRMVETLQWR